MSSNMARTKSLASIVKLRTVSVLPWRYRRVIEDSYVSGCLPFESL